MYLSLKKAEQKAFVMEHVLPTVAVLLQIRSSIGKRERILRITHCSLKTEILNLWVPFSSYEIEAGFSSSTWKEKFVSPAPIYFISTRIPFVEIKTWSKFASLRLAIALYTAFTNTGHPLCTFCLCHRQIGCGKHLLKSGKIRPKAYQTLIAESPVYPPAIVC